MRAASIPGSNGLLVRVNDDFLKEEDTAANYPSLFYIQNVSCVCLTTTSLVLKKFFAYYHAIFSRRLNKFNDLVTGVGHNIESGKDFTVDGLSGFSKKKKKKRRHR